MYTALSAARRTALLLVLAALVLAACGDDDASDETGEAMEQPEAAGAEEDAGGDEADADADEPSDAEGATGDATADQEVPDELPAEIPLPDDARVEHGEAGENPVGEYVNVELASSEDVDAWIARYQQELPEAFEIEQEEIAASADEVEVDYASGQPIWARWTFNGQGWGSGTVTIVDAEMWLEEIRSEADLHPEHQVEAMEEWLGDATMSVHVSVSE